MKTFDLNQFTNQLNLSRKADNVISKFSSLDKLVKFALQHCETEFDYNSLYDELYDFNVRLESFIKTYICNEHTENIEDSTYSSKDN